MTRTTKLLIAEVAGLALAGCSTAKMPPFASEHWTLAGNEVRSARQGIAINFGGDNPFPLSNMSNGEYDLNFITTDAQYAAYDPECRRLIKSVVGRLPIGIDSMELVLADQFIVFTPSVVNHWAPDLVRRADGAELVAEANPVASTVQPHDEIWRNLVFDTKHHRIIVVDRLVKNGRHLGIAYIMQGEDRHAPFTSAFHYDVTARRNAQPVGEHMRALLDITIAAAER